MTTELAARAIQLNAAGWRVFPITVTGDSPEQLSKRPMVSRYFGNAAFSAEEVRRWPWRRATALGWAVPDGYIVLDVDCKRGKEGESQLRRLEGVNGPLPRTAEQATPSGGRHLVYRVPGDRRWRGAVPSPDGSPSDIDLCHSKYRFMAIYDLSIFDQPVADLPPAWVDWITKAPHPQTRRDGTQPERPAGPTTVDATTEMSSAREGDRNNTLNKVVFRLAGAGDWTEQQASVEAAARDVGLTQSEIDDTVASATRAASSERLAADEWLEALASDPRMRGKRHRASVIIAAQAITSLAHRHGMVLGISVRDLGERLGVSHATSHRAIQLLRGYGHMKRVSLRTRDQATSYQLVTPAHLKRDTPQLQTTTTYTYTQATSVPSTGGVSRIRRPTISDIYGHDAFVRIEGRTLPKSAAWVLFAVNEGATTVGAITDVVPLSTSTVRSQLRVLESAGLVTCTRSGRITVHLVAESLMAALDRWAAWSGAEGNAEWLKLRHDEDRKRLADHRLEWPARAAQRKLTGFNVRRTGTTEGGTANMAHGGRPHGHRPAVEDRP